jgi:hypothetical protein
MSYTKAQAILTVERAAEKYIADQGFGTTGVALVVLGKAKGTTKCTAVWNWMKPVWIQFATTVAVINAWSGDSNVTDDMVDFTAKGAPPNTFLEILTEVNGIA